MSAATDKRRRDLREAQRQRRALLAEEGRRSVTIYLPEEIITAMDRAVDFNNYPGRAELIAEALRAFLEQSK